MTFPSPHSGHLLPARMILRFAFTSPLLSSEEDDAFSEEDVALFSEDVPCFAGDFPAEEAFLDDAFSGEEFSEGGGACCRRRLVLSHSTVWTSSETICLSSATNCWAL